MEDIKVPQSGLATRLHRKYKGMTPIDSVSRKVLLINKEVIRKKSVCLLGCLFVFCLGCCALFRWVVLHLVGVRVLVVSHLFCSVYFGFQVPIKLVFPSN